VDGGLGAERGVGIAVLLLATFLASSMASALAFLLSSVPLVTRSHDEIYECEYTSLALGD
jgi:Na+/proline symporter